MAFCPRARMIELCNEAHPDTEPRERMIKAIEDWFAVTARTKGWMQALWLKDSESDHGAGFMMSTILIQITPGS